MARDDDAIDERFAAYVRTRGQHHLRVAVLLTGDWHTAEDLVQASLAKLYRAWPRLDTATDPDAYLRRIMINTHRSWWRTRWRRETPAADLPDEAVVSGADAADLADRLPAGGQGPRGPFPPPPPRPPGPTASRPVIRSGGPFPACHASSGPYSCCATSRTCPRPTWPGCWAVRRARSRPTPTGACAPCGRSWAPASTPPAHEGAPRYDRHSVHRRRGASASRPRHRGHSARPGPAGRLSGPPGERAAPAPRHPDRGRSRGRGGHARDRGHPHPARRPALRPGSGWAGGPGRADPGRHDHCGQQLPGLVAHHAGLAGRWSGAHRHRQLRPGPGDRGGKDRWRRCRPL